MAIGKLLWGFAFTTFMIVAGCGDDDDDNGGAAGSAGTSSGGSSANVECDPADDGTCENDTDCPKVESGEARSSAQQCGLGCLEDDDPETCSVTCIVDDTGITSACAACYAATVKCSVDNCLAECAADPASQACADCQVDSGCRSEFDTCSGLPPQ